MVSPRQRKRSFPANSQGATMQRSRRPCPLPNGDGQNQHQGQHQTPHPPPSPPKRWPPTTAIQGPSKQTKEIDSKPEGHSGAAQSPSAVAGPGRRPAPRRRPGNVHPAERRSTHSTNGVLIRWTPPRKVGKLTFRWTPPGSQPQQTKAPPPPRPPHPPVQDTR